MIAIYMRVSKGHGQDMASQEAELKRWAAAQAGPVAWYRDKFTGKTMDRPGFNRLAKAMARGDVKTLVVWRLDRLGRTAKGLSTLFEDLQAKGINLISMREGIDLSTPAGRMMANILSSVAQYETEVRAERIHAGLDAARSAGKKLGPAVGSRTGKRLKVTPEQEEVIRRMTAEGSKVAAIARATGLSRPTVYSVIKMEVSR